MKDYSHIADVVDTDSWHEKILQRNLPSRTFVNVLTGNFMLGMEKVLSLCLREIKKLELFYQIR